MRNCFVPNCDKECKYDKRMMFLPPKNPELFEKWKIILPKKRQFKKTDKVCSRHFLKVVNSERKLIHYLIGKYSIRRILSRLGIM